METTSCILVFFEFFALHAVALQPRFSTHIQHDQSPSMYAGHLEYVFADLKKPLACPDDWDEECISQSNYKAIIDGLASKLHCNGLRVHIHPNITKASNYSDLYKDVWTYGKEKGMKMYANPFGTGSFDKSDEEFASWIADFANEWRPDFLGPFNEVGYEDAAEYISVLKLLAPKLSYHTTLVGPDKQHVDGTLELLTNHPDLIDYFDIISSHNAVDDVSATEEGWQKLAQTAGGAVWATENPREWDYVTDDGDQAGLQTTVTSEGPVTGLTLYIAFPRSINADGTLTSKGGAIAKGLVVDNSTHSPSQWWNDKILRPLRGVISHVR